MNQHVPALQRSLPEVVDEYDAKLAAIDDALEEFNRAGDALKMAATMNGVWGQTTIDTGRIYDHQLKGSLLKSAWRYVYQGLNIDRIASAADKKRFEQAMENPPPFTLDNIRGTFGDFILNPRGNILRGLAEVFCGLDQAYKSHDKVKIGVSGLPKRVILRNVSDHGWGRDNLTNILNALAAIQNKPLVTWQEVSALLADENALTETRVIENARKYGEPERTPVFARGVRLRRFENGNGHLHFDQATLLDINRGLAEYYGEVLPDTTDERPTKKHTSTTISKDLQYYPTPKKVIDDILSELYRIEGQRVLEPSCGCGRIMDALRKAGAFVFGIEVDPGRAKEARAKGHPVWCGNFLESPIPVQHQLYDRVVMNPPFYGKHYQKHVEHALRFLKPGGTLIAILPAAARYDHGFMHGRGTWNDLPVGSFSESGTNINTTVLTLHADG